MPPKTHRSAVVAIPPPDVWEPIQAIRRQYDRNVHRWMPHITLLYPFLPHEQFSTALPALLEVGRHVAPLQVTLTVVRSFTHAFGKATLWLDPEPQQALVALQAALQAAFPAYHEQSRFRTGFTPHLSVGQATSPHQRQQLLETLHAAWRPVQFTLTAVQLIWREADGPFQIAHTIPLQAALSLSPIP
jgi:RNA 2',3'-cyclic 3'-phosphodiesterase